MAHCIKCHKRPVSDNSDAGGLCFICQSSARAIRKARAVHGDRFDFTKEEENPRFFDMVITCNRCRSEFKTTIIKLLDSPHGGCKECQRRERAAAFIEKARAKHGNRYTYDPASYKSLKQYITFICPDSLHIDCSCVLSQSVKLKPLT